MTPNYSTDMHFRLPHERDSRIAACDTHWCAHNSDDWSKVTCPECLAIRDGVTVMQKFRVGNHEPREAKAFYGHARQEWDHEAQAYRYVNVVRTEAPVPA